MLKINQYFGCKNNIYLCLSVVLCGLGVEKYKCLITVELDGRKRAWLL